MRNFENLGGIKLRIHLLGIVDFSMRQTNMSMIYIHWKVIKSSPIKYIRIKEIEAPVEPDRL